MRYIGNKDSILNEIYSLLEQKNLLTPDYTFFDAFCGTGAVSSFLSQYYNIVLNDNMYSSYIYSLGRIVKPKCTFEKLGFDPIGFFNSNEKTCSGFFSKNYAPKVSGRMYFSDFNAGRIDYFRKEIQNWFDEKKITKEEYAFLLACLLESVSKIANIAGVYGAYLKKWDPRAVKKIIFLEPQEYHLAGIKSVRALNKNAEDIVQDIDCDILYMDPPYTKNKYPVQYHILETLALDDNPELKGITGARDISSISTAWSLHNQVEINFEKMVSKTRAKYILVSYSNDALMSREYILNVLRRHCKDESIVCKEIRYKKYRNTRTQSTNEHFEYLFFAEKKQQGDVHYICPLNYMGGKNSLIENILKIVPGGKNFFDIMGGGFNVGINIGGYQNVIYNDYNFIVKNLVQMFKEEDTLQLLNFIERTVKKYHLEKHNKDSFVAFREKWNQKFRLEKDKYKYLYVLILFGFQQQLRFNSKLQFNNTVGESGWNESVKEKVISFSRRIKEMNPDFYELDFEDLEEKISTGDTVYIDPPYLITLGSYNDGKRGFKGWTENDERRLLAFINRLLEKSCTVILSNVIVHKNNTNSLLNNWIDCHKVKKFLFHTRGREEILLVNE